jgi:hypothetical protein
MAQTLPAVKKATMKARRIFKPLSSVKGSLRVGITRHENRQAEDRQGHQP